MMFISENQLHQVLGLSMTRGTLLYRVPHPGCKRRSECYKGVTHYNYTHGLDEKGELQQKGISLSDVCHGMSKKDNENNQTNQF